METLSNGVKKPVDGDRGSVFWDALESNAQIQNDHSHDGVDSELLSFASVEKDYVLVTSSLWLASGNYYRKSVPMPAGFEWGVRDIQVFGSGGSYGLDGSRLYPKLEKITATIFYVYMPVNDQALNIAFV